MSTPPPTAAERFANILFCLAQTVAAQTGWGISLQLIALINTRIRLIKQRFARLAARIAAGTYRMRRPAKPRSHPRRPHSPGPLRYDFAWLIKLLPNTAAAGSQLSALLADPEMAALMAAAPAAMRRPLRSLCWMLGVTPPPVLALPATPRKPRPAPAKPPSPKPPPPNLPEWLKDRRKPWSLARIRGSPHRA